MSDDLDLKATHRQSQRALNQLLTITQYSLATYLVYAPSWTRRGEESLVEATRLIAADQKAETLRVGQLLVRRHGYADLGQFPTRFTEYNDLSLNYLAQRLIEHQRLMIGEIGRCAEQLEADPEAKRVAEGVLASETRHLGLLTRLALEERAPP